MFKVLCIIPPNSCVLCSDQFNVDEMFEVNAYFNYKGEVMKKVLQF